MVGDGRLEHVTLSLSKGDLDIISVATGVSRFLIPVSQSETGPAELVPWVEMKVVGDGRLELPTSTLSVSRSNQLS